MPCTVQVCHSFFGLDVELELGGNPEHARNLDTGALFSQVDEWPVMTEARLLNTIFALLSV
jgi:hypothetical protein